MASLKTLSIGILVASFMFIALFSIGDSWNEEFKAQYSPEITEIQAGINNSLVTMYYQGKSDSEIIEESNIYSGSSDLSVISAEPYKILKSNIKLTKLGLNVTAQISRMGLMPDWVFTLAIAIFLLVITYLVLNAIFKVEL